MVTQETNRSPRNPTKNSDGNTNSNNSMLSPRFKSVAEMAGWDEEALLLASLVVEDTPERNLKAKRRSGVNFKTPPSNSRRKRRARRSTASIPVTVFNLDDEEESTSIVNNTGGEEKKNTPPESIKTNSPQKVEKDEKCEPSTSTSGASSMTIPCMDRLREELSCAICLEVCFEPSTTPCGHSFCKKCLRSAADKCGKRCPKCRQLISNGRSCTVNTVLWNTIQLLFPEEVEARKVAGAINNREAERPSPPGRIVAQSTSTYMHASRRTRDDRSSRAADVSNRSRRGVPNQDEDAALALRLQREEVMAVYRGSTLARDNLRAMAQRAINNRVRTRAV